MEFSQDVPLKTRMSQMLDIIDSITGRNWSLERSTSMKVAHYESEARRKSMKSVKDSTRSEKNDVHTGKNKHTTKRDQIRSSLSQNSLENTKIRQCLLPSRKKGPSAIKEIKSTATQKNHNPRILETKQNLKETVKTIYLTFGNDKKDNLIQERTALISIPGQEPKKHQKGTQTNTGSRRPNLNVHTFSYEVLDRDESEVLHESSNVGSQKTDIGLVKQSHTTVEPISEAEKNSILEQCLENVTKILEEMTLLREAEKEEAAAKLQCNLDENGTEKESRKYLRFSEDTTEKRNIKMDFDDQETLNKSLNEVDIQPTSILQTESPELAQTESNEMSVIENTSEAVSEILTETNQSNDASNSAESSLDEQVSESASISENDGEELESVPKQTPVSSNRESSKTPSYSDEFISTNERSTVSTMEENISKEEDSSITSSTINEKSSEKPSDPREILTEDLPTSSEVSTVPSEPIEILTEEQLKPPESLDREQAETFQEPSKPSDSLIEESFEPSEVVTEEPSEVVTEEPSVVVTEEPSEVVTEEPSEYSRNIFSERHSEHSMKNLKAVAEAPNNSKSSNEGRSLHPITVTITPSQLDFSLSVEVDDRNISEGELIYTFSESAGDASSHVETSASQDSSSKDVTSSLVNESSSFEAGCVDVSGSSSVRDVTLSEDSRRLLTQNAVLRKRLAHISDRFVIKKGD